MVSIANGLWWDHSQPAVLDATLTLPVNQGNYLLSALTFLVTVAGASFWAIVAVILHSSKVRGPTASALDLQHQVSLQNTSDAATTLLQAWKIHRAWSKKPPKGLFRKTCSLALPAGLIWAAFTVASVFTSRVANKAYGPVVARAQPENCGFWQYNIGDINGQQAANTKVLNNTVEARAYVTNFYANTSSSPTSRSRFIQSVLPYNVSTSGPCPIPAVNRCILGHNGAYSMTTDFLDSQTMLGINAKPADRVTVQLQTTCSPVHAKDLTTTAQFGNNSFIEFHLGSAVNTTGNLTYMYNVETPATDVNYLLVPQLAYAQGPSNEIIWSPIPDFNRTDADVSVFFLSQNNLAYLSQVFDPWFSANGSFTRQLTDRTVYLPDYFVNIMVCADQYVMCNPTTSTCTALGGIYRLEDEALVHNTPGFSTAQSATAGRLIQALSYCSTFSSVVGLGSSALWASNLLFGDISAALPDSQWEAEVRGWFTTNLAKFQAYVVEYAAKTTDLGKYGTVVSPYSVRPNSSTASQAYTAALQDQCGNQLVQTAGEVQNFSFLGVMIIVCVSVVLWIVSLTLECCLDCIARRRHKVSIGVAARQGDDKLHLLRMALAESGVEGTHWVRGRGGVPVLEGTALFQRPDGAEKFGTYRSSPAGKGDADGADNGNESAERTGNGPAPLRAGENQTEANIAEDAHPAPGHLPASPAV